MRLFQVVIRYFGAKVMNMMESDITGNPLQHSRKLIIRAALNSSFNIVPLRFILEVRILELMLYIEEPNADQPRKEQNGSLDQNGTLAQPTAQVNSPYKDTSTNWSNTCSCVPYAWRLCG